MHICAANRTREDRAVKTACLWLRDAMRLFTLFALAAPAVALDPLGSCWRSLESLRDECSDHPCSNDCIGKTDELFRRWDECADARDGLVDLFNQQVDSCNCNFPRNQFGAIFS